MIINKCFNIKDILKKIFAYFLLLTSIYHFFLSVKCCYNSNILFLIFHFFYMLVMGISLIHVISLITLLPSNVNLRTFLSFFSITHLLSTYLNLSITYTYCFGTSWSWSYGSWICSYLCNQYLSPLTLCVRIPLMARCTRYNIMW
jgi:hypothetical protein